MYAPEQEHPCSINNLVVKLLTYTLHNSLWTQLYNTTSSGHNWINLQDLSATKLDPLMKSVKCLLYTASVLWNTNLIYSPSPLHFLHYFPPLLHSPLHFLHYFTTLFSLLSFTLSFPTLSSLLSFTLSFTSLHSLLSSLPLSPLLHYTLFTPLFHSLLYYTLFSPSSTSFTSHSFPTLKANHYYSHDINVTGVWSENITGMGVVVAVVDSGKGRMTRNVATNVRCV